MRLGYLGPLLMSILLINTLLLSCGGSYSNSNYGDNPDNAVPMGKTIVVTVPWESANAELSVIEVKENIPSKSIIVKLNGVHHRPLLKSHALVHIRLIIRRPFR